MSSCNKSEIEWEPRECDENHPYSLAGADQDSYFEELLAKREHLLDVLGVESEYGKAVANRRKKTKLSKRRKLLSKLKKLAFGNGFKEEEERSL